MSRYLSLACAALLFCLFATPKALNAQTSFSLQGPTADREVEEGDDFAFEVLKNEWDNEQIADLPWQEGVNQVKLTNYGTITAVNKVVGGYFFFLFPGFISTVPAEAPQGDKGSPRYGLLHPINASKYNYICIRARVGFPSSWVLHWTNSPNAVSAFPDGSNLVASASYGGTGWEIRCVNLANPSVEVKAGSWSGNVVALRYDPSQSAPAGTGHEFDWTRLVDPNSAPVIRYSWTAQGATSNSPHILYADNDASGFDGTPLAIFKVGTDPGFYDVVTAGLQPGDYYFYVGAGNVHSGYSKRLTIRGRTDLVFTAPNEMTGRDYFTQIGTPIHGVSSAEITNIAPNIPQVLRQFVNWSFTGDPEALDGAVFTGFTELASAYPPQPHSDNELTFITSNSYPIVPGRECQLSYRVSVDYSQAFDSIRDSVEFGNVWRVIAAERHLFDPQSGDYGGHIIYPGMQWYTVNLCTLPSVNSGISWINTRSVRLLRLDPTETIDKSVQFKVDEVRLTTETYVTAGAYDIQFVLNGGQGPFRVDLYRDSDPTGSDGTLIGSVVNVQQGSFSYRWDLTGLPDQSVWYVYAKVSDGLNSYDVYAPKPIIVGALPDQLPLTRTIEQDMDNDGRSDPVVLRQGPKGGRVCTRDRRRRLVCTTTRAQNGSLFVLGSTMGVRSFPILPGAFTPVSYDLDGDGASEWGWYGLNGNLLNWNFVLSTTNQLFQRAFGIAGDVPAFADWNGNGRKEITVFRGGQWWILDENDQITFVQWGLPGDVSNPADFDGDGRADLAVWRPSDGTWYVFGSKNGQILTLQYGLPGDVPVAADYDGDGKADIAVFRPSLGAWFVHPSSGAPDLIQFFGLPTDVPKRGLDFDGNGIANFTVYRPSTSQWYHLDPKSGALGILPFGLPGDLTPAT